MKKYIILAIMPCIFQSVLHAKDQFAKLDQMLAQYYQDTCKAIKSNAKHHFEPVLHALIHDAKKGGNRRRIAIEYIVLLEKQLEIYRSAEIKKLDNFSWAVGSKPTIISQEINPALKIVKKALKDLKVTKSEYSTAYYIALGALGLAVGVYAAMNQDAIFDLVLSSSDPLERSMYSKLSSETKDQVAHRWAKAAASIIYNQHANSNLPCTKEELEKVAYEAFNENYSNHSAEGLNFRLRIIDALTKYIREKNEDIDDILQSMTPPTPGESLENVAHRWASIATNVSIISAETKSEDFMRIYDTAKAEFLTTIMDKFEGKFPSNTEDIIAFKKDIISAAEDSAQNLLQ